MIGVYSLDEGILEESGNRLNRISKVLHEKILEGLLSGILCGFRKRVLHN